MFKIGQSETYIYTKCKLEVETVEHFILKCIGYINLRMSVFGYFELGIKDMPSLSPVKLIEFIDKSGRFCREDSHD